MSYIDNQQRMNDIIFADRNQAYGAYAIRSTYGNTVFKSLSFMMLGMGTIMALAFYMNHTNGPEQSEKNEQLVIQDTAIRIIQMDLKKEEPAMSRTEEPPAPRNENKPTDENRTIQVVDSTLIAEKTSTTAIETNSVPVTDDLAKGPVTGSTTIGGGGGGGGGERPDTSKVHYVADSDPEFDGGLSALYRFVSKNLKYPNWASSEGKEGTVFVRFVVDENGNVGSLKLQNSAGYGMDEEAMRVVGLIPKFKTPAKVNGTPVKVYYQMPIRFRFRN